MVFRVVLVGVWWFFRMSVVMVLPSFIGVFVYAVFAGLVVILDFWLWINQSDRLFLGHYHPKISKGSLYVQGFLDVQWGTGHFFV